VAEPVRLAQGELEAVFLPAQGMLGASLRHRGVEMLRRVDDLPLAAAKGTTAGIPLLHPWANRLEGLRYRAAGRKVQLDPSSPLLHLDANGLPIHGVPWSALAWEVAASTQAHVSARLAWSREDLLAVFPFPHHMELTATLDRDGLTLETTLVAGSEGAVPVCFGFHPYFGLPDLPRAGWRLATPAMQRLALDARMLPTGAEEPWDRFDAELGARGFDDGFRLDGAGASFSLSGAGRRIRVDFLSGYAYAQLYAPPGQDLVAIEPMTAPTNALRSGAGLELVAPGERYRAAFRVRVDSDA
jgi:galactose mutarotase-like enzyme